MTSPLQATAPRFHGIDALRGIAASLIVVIHAVHILPLDPGISRSFGGFLGYMVMGVPLFFIISAFSMSAAYAGGFAGSGDLGRYAIRRLCRIVPLFYVMLAAWLGYFHVLGSPPKDGATLLANLTFTFSLFPQMQTSIIPAGWSIGVEMVFYAVFPLLIMIRGVGAGVVMVVASFAASWAWNQPLAGEVPSFYYWTHPVTNAPYFALGLLGWRLLPWLAAQDGRRVAPILLAGGLAAVALMVAFGPVVSNQQVVILPVPPVLIAGWGVGLAAIMLSQALRPAKLIVNPVTAFLGQISYSLYLLHPLVIYSTGITVWIAGQIASPRLAFLCFVVAVFAVTVPLAWLLYRLVEAPFITLGRHLTRASTPRAANPDPA